MPRQPSNTMLFGTQKAQSDVMGDLCTILRTSYVTGTLSDDDVSLATGTLQGVCGFYFTNGQIKQNGQILLVDYDVVMRLPIWTPIFLHDQIVLVEKGTTTVSGTFTPTELPEIGATVQTVHLKRTT